MRHFCLLMAAMLFSVMAFAQQMYADFTQTRVLKASGKTTHMQGHIVYDGNDQLSMVYSDPEGDYFIIDGSLVKINLLNKKSELNADKVKAVSLQRATLLNCLSGQWEQAAVDNNADTVVEEKDGFRNILIKTKGKVPRGGYSSVDLTYRLADGMLTRMVLEEAAGVVNTYELSH